MHRIAIIIVNWNTGKLLAQCLKSIAELPEQEHIAEVVVIDNASSDNSLTQAQAVSTPERVTYLELNENAGFAKANNRGIEHAVKRHGKDIHILLLNPDTEVRAGAVRNMLEVLDRRADAGIVGPRLLEADGSTQPSVRRFPTLGVFIFLFLKLHWLYPNAPLWRRYMASEFSYDKEQTVDQVMGAAFLIRNKTLQNIGMLDERFWIWFEEVDYCKQAQKAGWKIVYTSSANILHYGGVSFNQLIGIQKSLPFLKSSLLYAHKHIGIVAAAVLAILWPAAFLLTLPASLFHIISKKKNSKQL